MLVPQVNFVREGSVDSGGPKMEFLRLLAATVQNSYYFQCGDGGKGFLNFTAVGYNVSLHSFVILL